MAILFAILFLFIGFIVGLGFSAWIFIVGLGFSAWVYGDQDIETMVGSIS